VSGLFTYVPQAGQEGPVTVTIHAQDPLGAVGKGLFGGGEANVAVSLAQLGHEPSTEVLVRVMKLVREAGLPEPAVGRSSGTGLPESVARRFRRDTYTPARQIAPTLSQAIGLDRPHVARRLAGAGFFPDRTACTTVDA
jgi:hypothetical protein